MTQILVVRRWPPPCIARGDGVRTPRREDMTAAMENERAPGETPADREWTRLQTLQQVHALLDAGDDVEESVSAVLDLLGERHRLRPCLLSLLDERTGEVHVAVAPGFTRDAREQARYRLGEGITGRVVLSGRPVVVPHVGAEPLYLNRSGAF